MLNHIGRFGSPEVIHIDQGPAFHNELVQELLRLGGNEHSFATAYSSEKNGIVDVRKTWTVHVRLLLILGTGLTFFINGGYISQTAVAFFTFSGVMYSIFAYHVCTCFHRSYE